MVMWSEKDTFEISISVEMVLHITKDGREQGDFLFW